MSNLGISNLGPFVNCPRMLLGRNSIQETLYDILSVKEDASYEDIRASYRSAVLSSHPDKLEKNSEESRADRKSDDKFLKVQKAWEVLSNSRSRALYDSELQALRQHAITAEDVSLEDMMIEDGRELLEFYYQCRCGDYFSTDSLELGKLGYKLLRDDGEICLATADALPVSLVLPCGSCSLHIRKKLQKHMA